MEYNFFTTTHIDPMHIPAWNAYEIANEVCIKYGESLLTAQGRIAVVREWGYDIYNQAKNNYIWNTSSHVLRPEIREKYDREYEKYKAAHDGTATSDTLLEF